MERKRERTGGTARGNGRPIGQRGWPALGLILALAATSASAQWESEGNLKVPQAFYTFLAATPSGDLLAATFNTGQVGSPARDIPAVLIRNPTSADPKVIDLLKVPFVGQRGFGGVACDSKGNIYLSGDTGDPATCFLRKFKPDGTPDPTFGQNGEILPQRRCLGVDVFGDYLIMAVDWCQFQVYNASTGKLLGESPKGPPNIYVRDIAIDPVSLRIYGVAAGSVVVWESGTPWEPQKYVFRAITPAAGIVRAGEGISLDPIKRDAIVTPIPGNTLLEVSDQGNITRTTISSAQSDAHLADTVVSFDGTTLFISDMTTGQIHVLRRSAPETSAPVTATYPSPPPASAGTTAPGTAAQTPSPSAAPPAAPTQQVPQVVWNRSYQQVVEQARRENKPMVVYFRMNGVAKCTEVEKNILLTPAFNQRAQSFICVFEDIAFNRLLAYRFGVFRVPQIVVLNREGEIVGRFTYNIDANALFAAMASAQ